VINKIPEEVENHFKGRKFQRRLEQVKKKIEEREQNQEEEEEAGYWVPIDEIGEDDEEEEGEEVQNGDAHEENGEEQEADDMVDGSNDEQCVQIISFCLFVVLLTMSFPEWTWTTPKRKRKRLSLRRAKSMRLPRGGQRERSRNNAKRNAR
jgi:hypothetical protein